MTKQQLIKALEPFDDDIELMLHINQITQASYLGTPRLFYRMSSDGDGEIVLAVNHPGTSKTVELKV